MTRQVKGVVLSLYRVYWSDSQRPVVLSRFISAGAEERVDAFTERVIESVDVDFSIDVVERHLQKPRGHGVIGKPHLVTKEVWMFVILCALGRQKYVNSISHTAPVHSQSPQISRSYVVGGSDGRLWRVQCERRTCSWREERGGRRALMTSSTFLSSSTNRVPVSNSLRLQEQRKSIK